MTSTRQSAACTLHRGHTPLLLSLPHVGTEIAAELQAQYTEAALCVPDTDWFLDEVYDFARELGASVLVPRWSRYVIDLNRPPENAPMYPGVNNTELCPTRDFTGQAIYRAGAAPGPAQVAERLERYWQPYHQALADELARLRATHGHALLWDGHSIKSELPWLFEGRLPDLNVGTVDGASCDPRLRTTLVAELAGQNRYSHITDGRFKGGYITRRYGRPAQGVHAVQLEMCWSTYMDETPPWRVAPQRCAELRPLLRALLVAMLDWKPA
ncbi:MAG: N-formylglutamate deformylase [Burkholderiales bacterium]|nr:N-formylglutamate deformylase [Burkholderiales bacterium]